MTFYSGSSSLGSCNACGSPVNDGGQSGAYCSNPQCRYGWYGGNPPAEPSERARAAERRQGNAGYSLVFTGPRGDTIKMIASAKTRDVVVRRAAKQRAFGWTLTSVAQWNGNGSLVPVEDDLTL